MTHTLNIEKTLPKNKKHLKQLCDSDITLCAIDSDFDSAFDSSNQFDLVAHLTRSTLESAQ